MTVGSFNVQLAQSDTHDTRPLRLPEPPPPPLLPMPQYRPADACRSGSQCRAGGCPAMQPIRHYPSTTDAAAWLCIGRRNRRLAVLHIAFASVLSYCMLASPPLSLRPSSACTSCATPCHAHTVNSRQPNLQLQTRPSIASSPWSLFHPRAESNVSVASALLLVNQDNGSSHIPSPSHMWHGPCSCPLETSAKCLSALRQASMQLSRRRLHLSWRFYTRAKSVIDIVAFP